MRTLLVTFTVLVLLGGKGLAQYGLLGEAMAMRQAKQASEKAVNKRVYRNPVLNFYKRVLAGQLASNCAYSPTCSAYSQACLKEHSVPKALALSLFRLQRCNPFTHLENQRLFGDAATDDPAYDY